MDLGPSRMVSAVAPLALALAIVAGVTALRARAEPPSDLRGVLNVASPADGEPGGPSIRFVLQPADCPAVDDILAAWSRAADTLGVLEGAVEAVLLEATESDAREIAERIGIGVPVRASGDRLAPALRALGFRATPILLAFDGAGRLRVAAPVHESPRPSELLSLLRIPPIHEGGDR